MLTVVLGARRGLLVHLGHHGLNFAEFTAVFGRATASVLVDAVDTSPAILAHVVHAVVDVVSAVHPRESRLTLASVMSKVVNALTSILAGAELGSGTKGDFGLAEFPGESAGTGALVGPDFVDTGGIVLTSVADAIVCVDFASGPLKTQGTNASETSLILAYRSFKKIRKNLRESASLHDLALGVIGTRIAITSINNRVAILPIKSRHTLTLVVPIRQRSASGFILTRIVLAQIAFSQNSRINIFHALEQIRRAGQ